MAKSSITKKESAGGLIYFDGKFLLIKDLDTGMHEIPKGGLQSGEDKESACIREISEETGYLAKIITYLSTTRFLLDWKDGNTYDKIIHYYLLELVDISLQPNLQREEDENFENVWVTAEGAQRLLTHDDALEALQRAIVYVRP